MDKFPYLEIHIATLNHHEKAAQHLVFAAHHLLKAHEAPQASDNLKALYHADIAEKQGQQAETHQAFMTRMEATETTEKTTLVC